MTRPFSPSSRAPFFHIVTCEHAGNRIPSRYAEFFRAGGDALRSHRGYDIGSLRMARELADTLAAPLVVSAVSRLLIDLNRSPHRPDLYSEFTQALDPALRQEIFNRYYLPYRTKVETRVAQAHAAGARVTHLSSHSFTPTLHGIERETDVGLLYDPARAAEATLCERWRAALLRRMPQLDVRMNTPYLGTADGLTTALRGRFAEDYVGIELEINQKHVRGGSDWRALRAAVAQALQEVLAAA
jgi:predicted N-formylglutamate amidohydrolase